MYCVSYNAITSGIEEKFGVLEEYVEGSPLVRKVLETEDGNSEMEYISTRSLERFCSGAHPSLLWPIYMLQRQVLISFVARH